MPLTPAEVHNVAFKKPSIGKRGYDEDEVDAFLDLVEAELEPADRGEQRAHDQGRRTTRPAARRRESGAAPPAARRAGPRPTPAPRPRGCSGSPRRPPTS